MNYLTISTSKLQYSSAVSLEAFGSAEELLPVHQTPGLPVLILNPSILLINHQ